MIVGTAGHIDHGKTALVKALTGVDADRLKEEKARGITIDLGFAYTSFVPERITGFVDVPGHERFIHTMLAGAGGIDFALLVIAADDGIMPQTREHLAILDLLGVSRGAVALTKCDLADNARRASLTGDIHALLARTSLAEAPVLPVSALTGEGIEALRDLLAQAERDTPVVHADGLFRLAVDRSFTLAGAGIVVTGTVLSGSVATGDRVAISPPGLIARVRGIHAQNVRAERGVAGQRCALNLAGDLPGKDAIARGDVALDPVLHAPTARIDADLRLLASEAKPVAMAKAAQSNVETSGAGSTSGPTATSPTSPNSTCSPNKTARFAMMPTTAAVTAASAPASQRMLRAVSTYGAPTNIHRKHGTKVNQSVTAAPASPPQIGSKPESRAPPT